jgi:hypothetical protein
MEQDIVHLQMEMNTFLTLLGVLGSAIGIFPPKTVQVRALPTLLGIQPQLRIRRLAAFPLLPTLAVNANR